MYRYRRYYRRRASPLCGLIILGAIFIINFIPWYWYIILPIFIVVIVIFLIILFQKSHRSYIPFDNNEKQEEFEKETGYKAIENGEFTSEYKSWLTRTQYQKKPQYQQQQIKVEETKRIFCKYCGNENSKAAKYCENCGSPLY
jgi:energy-coupling factor transporter transmembrane protein EcfT